MRISRYDITANDHQFVLSEVKVVTDKKSKNFGEEVLTNKSFHSTWKGLVGKLTKLELMIAVNEFDDIESVSNAFAFNMSFIETEFTKVLGR